MKKRNEEFHNDPWDRDFYETGSTRPPKNHGGAVAVLLVAVIALGGLTTAMGLMNIRMFKMLETLRQENNADDLQMVQWDSTVNATHAWEENAPTQPEFVRMLDMECVTVSSFDRRYYELPQGCLVMELAEGGMARRAGICVGDVIVSMNGRAVDSTEELAELIENNGAGDGIRLVVYRSHTGQQVTVEIE